MPSIPWVPTVTAIVDGETVEASTVNPIISQLAQREQYLFERFEEVTGQSSLVAFAQPIFPAESLAKGAAVYFKSDGVDSGIALARADYTADTTSSLFSPNSSSFVFGLVKSLTTDTVDVHISGLIDLDYDIDDPTNGILESGQEFAIGPYFLSKSQAGKITQNPSGVAVYVGYAKSKTQILLNASVEEFSQFFTRYKFELLDRPNGTPVLADGTWTVTTTADNVSATAIKRVGWIGVGDIPSTVVPADSVPDGAKFFYGLPADLLTSDEAVYDALDTPGISTDEKNMSKELLRALPAYPADLVILSQNGIAQIQRSAANPDGMFLLDGYGLWWFNDADGYQPWAGDITPYEGNPWVAADWPDWKGSPERRSRLALQFVNFNPDLRTAVVTTIRPFVSDTIDSSKVLTFLNRDTNEESLSGDLKVKFTLDTATPTVEGTITPSAIKSISFNPLTGKLAPVTGPVLTSATGSRGVVVTTSATGAITIAFQTAGLTGQVESLEPVNARLEYLGVHSFLSMVNPATMSTGFIGKFSLPPDITPGNKLVFVLYMLGKSTVTDGTYTGFKFDYATSRPVSLAETGQNFNIGSSFTSSNLWVPMGAYTAYDMMTTTPVGTSPAQMEIPASLVAGDTVVNFRLTRMVPDGKTAYTADVGIIGVYWKLVAA